jgi:hypothetical protein
MTRLAPRVAALHVLIVDRWPGGTEDRLCAELGRTLPRSLTYMATITADGYPTSTPGAPDRGSGTGGAHDKLGAIVARREHASASYAALCAAVGDAAACVALVDRSGVKSALRAAQRLVDEWQPPVVVQPSTHRCHAPDGEHLEPWVRPECENLAVKAGMCHACYMRRRRWLAEQEQLAS